MLNKIFGNNLKYFRFKKRYTQEYLAEYMERKLKDLPARVDMKF